MTQSANSVRMLTIMHLAIFMGTAVFAAIVTFLVYSKRLVFDAKAFEEILQVIAILVSAVAVLLGNQLFKKRLAQIQLETNNRKKFEMYRSISIVQWALLEGASMVCIVGFLLSANYAFLGLVAFLLLFLMMLRPNVVKISLLTGIPQDELKTL